MNLYHAMIELKSGAKALAFAAAAEEWLGTLESRGMIQGWRLLRRKFGLASGRHSDFMLEIEMSGLQQLEDSFMELGKGGSYEDEQLYARVHDMIATVDIGLYRPYPDEAQRERIALI
jgi:hypothetical protein